MPIVSQTEFNRLLRIGAIDGAGEVQFPLNFDGVQYNVGAETFSAGDYTSPFIGNIGVEPVIVAGNDGTVTGWMAINPNTSMVYLKLFDSAAPIIGTTAPIAVIPIPPGASSANPGIYSKDDNQPYRSYTSALSVAVVTGLDNDDDTAPEFEIYLEMTFL